MPSPLIQGVCVQNHGYAAAMELRKIFRFLDDLVAEKRGFGRVIDDSEEDYLYPVRYFVPIEVPRAGAKAFVAKSK
ncbi:MAG: hypothetical protein SFX18_05665 [Pirellulales bacterium]|nr:hypothetical protein [Pirellulales bacterium]